MHERCWICDRAGSLQDEKLMDPRTGQWAHLTCVNRTIAGAGWRMSLACRALFDAFVRSFKR